MDMPDLPKPDTEEFVRMMDFITTGGKFPGDLGPNLNAEAIKKKIATLRHKPTEEEQR